MSTYQSPPLDPAAAPAGEPPSLFTQAQVAEAVAAEREACALIVCPEPHVEEERECASIAAFIRARQDTAAPAGEPASPQGSSINHDAERAEFQKFLDASGELTRLGIATFAWCAWMARASHSTEPLLKLLDYCDASDDCKYGTLSVSLVRELVNEALQSAPAAPAGEPAQAGAPLGKHDGR